MPIYPNAKWSVGYYPFQRLSATPLLSLWAGRQGPPVRVSRALQMSAVPSQTERRKDGPLTKDSCQSDGVLTLGSPMSSDRGDKCLANQHATKSQPFPELTPAHEVTACAGSQYPCS